MPPIHSTTTLAGDAVDDLPAAYWRTLPLHAISETHGLPGLRHRLARRSPTCHPRTRPCCTGRGRWPNAAKYAPLVPDLLELVNLPDTPLDEAVKAHICGQLDQARRRFTAITQRTVTVGATRSGHGR